MTNYEKLKQMSIDEMAKLFYGIIHERDLKIMRVLEQQGIEAYLIEMPLELTVAYHKQWLEMEVEE